MLRTLATLALPRAARRGTSAFRLHQSRAVTQSLVQGTQAKPHYRAFSTGYRLKPHEMDHDGVNFKTMQENPWNGYIPRDKVEVHTALSGGKGGQHVNKVETKVILRFNLQAAKWIPDWVKMKLQLHHKSHLSAHGIFTVTSTRHRTQHQNLEDAFERLQGILDSAGTPSKAPDVNKVQRLEGLRRKANEQRLKDKKYRAERKEMKKPRWDD